MERTGSLRGSVFGLPASSTDGNRLYSILLDARASSVSENMYDVAERLLASEAANAKTVLEQLWALKKNMEEDAQTGTVDLIIDFYQEKMDILRNKEEKIKKVSRDSRSLLEEKRKRDREIATIKQEVRDCSSEIERLTKKLDQLKVKEQELTLIETQVQRELQGNANEVINGLYEIILARQDGMSVSDADGDDDRPARGAVIPDGVGEEDEEGSGDAAWEPSAKTGLGLERETDPDSSNGQVDNGGGGGVGECRGDGGVRGACGGRGASVSQIGGEDDAREGDWRILL